MENVIFQSAKNSDVLTQELKGYLLESMDYGSISFVNTAIEILKILKIRIDRGDRITDEQTDIVYNRETFREFVRTNFSEYILEQVYATPKKEEKVYFQLQECDDGYNLVMTSDGKQPTYAWISSLSERFSLVYMRSTGIVYIKNVKTGNYSPFISGNGKYCRYDQAEGKLIEV